MEQQARTPQSPTPRPSSPLSPTSPKNSESFQQVIYKKFFSKEVTDKDGFLLLLIQQKNAGAPGKCAALRFFILHHTKVHSPEIINSLLTELSTFYSNHVSKLQEDPGLPSLTVQVERWSKEVIKPLLLKHEEVLRRCVLHIPQKNNLRKDAEQLLEQVSETIPTRILAKELGDSIDQGNRLEKLHLTINNPKKNKDSKSGTPTSAQRDSLSFGESRSPQGSLSEMDPKVVDSDQKKGPGGRTSTSATRTPTGSVEKQPLGGGQARSSMSQTAAIPAADQDIGSPPGHPFLLSPDKDELNKSYSIRGSVSDIDETFKRQREDRSYAEAYDAPPSIPSMDNEPLQPHFLKRLGLGVLFFLFNPARLSEDSTKKWGWRVANVLVWVGIGFAFPPLLALWGLKLPALFAGVAMNTTIATQASTAVWGIIYAALIQAVQLIPGYYRRCTVKPVQFPVTPDGRRLTDDEAPEDRSGFRRTDGLGKMGSLSRSDFDPDADPGVVAAHKRGSVDSAVYSLPDPSHRRSISSEERSLFTTLPARPLPAVDSPIYAQTTAAPPPAPTRTPLPTDKLTTGSSATSFGYGALSDADN